MSDPYLTLAGFIEQTIAPRATVDAVARLRLATAGDEASDDAAAALLETSETPIGVVDTTSAISVLSLTAKETVEADPVDYATITAYKRTPAGVVTALGSVDTSSTDWLAGIPVPISTVESVSAGDLITYKATKAGAGVALPEILLELEPTVNFVTKRIATHQSWIESRLMKRYLAPFAAPVPQIVIGWLVALVTLDVFSKRGFNPGSAQDEEAIIGRAQRARDEIKEAADSKDGLFDLPVRQDLPGTSAVTRGGPLSYSEASPYTWTDKQAELARNE